MQAFLLRQMMPTWAGGGGWLSGGSTSGGGLFGRSAPQNRYSQQGSGGCCVGPSQLVYTGPGGNYDARMEYQYVGQGAGEYDYKPRRNWCLVPVCFLCLVLLALLLMWLWWCKIHQRTTTALFDCEKDVERWEDEWGAEKQGYCCSLTGEHCVHVTTEMTTSPPYHCGWGYGNWESLWSEDKKAWCCQHTNRGCLVPATTTIPPWTCSDDVNWEETWPPPKKEWCCKVEGKGCPVPEHDCDSVFSDWGNDWSWEIRQWCCTHCEENVCHAKKCIPFMPAPMRATTPARMAPVAQTVEAPAASSGASVEFAGAP